MKRSVAQLPLHGGKAPPWLFARMKHLAGAITMAVVDAFGPQEMLRRLADPWWFQAFGCVLGFDWHSSGLTTVTCGAMKEAAKIYGPELGILVAGGKGATSRKTPGEIQAASDRHGIAEGDKLIYASRTSAKVDSAAVQDGYHIYHHSFFFTPAGSWCVVQQGMNDAAGMARRYHWLGESVNDFVCEPHSAISDLSESPRKSQIEDLPLLNMVAQEAQANRDASALLVRTDLKTVLDELARMTEGPTLFLPAHHPVRPADVNLPRLEKILRVAHESAPRDFEALLGVAGVGPATVRAISLVAELIYSAPASHRDPAKGSVVASGACLPASTRGGMAPSTASGAAPNAASGDSAPLPQRRYADYSYAHGGKDGFPFPVDRVSYDKTIAVLGDAVRKSRLGESEKTDALRRISRLFGE